ncbi:MAG: GNAT family N-acetyltransferase [Gemmatimonadetes bacterium]|nr:GNAT family N-acetyltransferase [Gemmatimonadota bacterium]NIQ59609.1 GNAT family N-acetyltransferase [Gemmatimonadota bacterium]NIU79815.1 GNAT family N-acetyltransferase [Gammaproteobacteria bacterium]NIX48319.1 GNAT family N-acetyltransferase [Gemmatimonadota bacterium]NIY12764.1 GNAT family N-acetyltransferase [Gemmatimonadota bacterium]
MTTIRAAGTADIPVWAELRSRLWPEGSVAEHRAELPDWLARSDTCSRIAVASTGRVIGFLEGQLRSHADGCATSPVAYLEGWFVAREHRRAGVGRALVASFEAWARKRGCEELASDTWPENEASLQAHRRLGFEEVDCIITLRKPLDAGIAVPASSRPPARWSES